MLVYICIYVYEESVLKKIVCYLIFIVFINIKCRVKKKYVWINYGYYFDRLNVWCFFFFIYLFVFVYDSESWLKYKNWGSNFICMCFFVDNVLDVVLMYCIIGI